MLVGAKQKSRSSGPRGGFNKTSDGKEDRHLALLIVQDIFPSETAKYVHIVLPAAAVGEKEATFTNAARRV